MANVARQGKRTTKTSGGLHVLAQRFRFDGVTASQLADALWTCPLVGRRAIFANKSYASTEDTGETRTVTGFVPAPGFRFDVTIRRIEPLRFVVRFEQPDRGVPYLDGELVWQLADDDGAAVLDEQINTAAALEQIERPLTGPSASLRRWLFFKLGHAKVMDDMTKNLASLLGESD